MFVRGKNKKIPSQFQCVNVAEEDQSVLLYSFLCMYRTIRILTFLGPHSRFGDKLLTFRVLCPQTWECGAKRVNIKSSLAYASGYEST